MNFYDRWVLPPIVDLVMRQHQLQNIAARWLPLLMGGCSRLGFGSGLNFPLYGKKVEIVFGIDSAPFACDCAQWWHDFYACKSTPEMSARRTRTDMPGARPN